ncbi:MAG TPA: peptidase M23 [Micromonosporaceae bacterium]|nr:peptidase M23 [Micromonosporaceae bacterium]HCU49602.1 peptidase M23 [Micromonosporaceae bacterium]
MLLRKMLGTTAAALTAAAAILIPASPALAAPTFKLPFPCGQVWSGQTRTNHSPANAIDFNRTDDTGDPVVASAPGTVSLVRDLGGSSYGRYVVIDHGGGYSTLYAHLQSYIVSVGDRLEYGTRIGYVGTTGGSTGPHLHFEQRLNGSAIRIAFDGAGALYWGTRNYTSSNQCGANIYSPQMVCGSGFNVVNQAGLVSGGVSYGRVYVLYNSGSGQNCTVTIKHRSTGTASSTSAYLEPQGSTRTTDSGNFAWYAGPVKRSAPGVCIKWGGSVSGVAYNSGWTNCG